MRKILINLILKNNDLKSVSLFFFLNKPTSCNNCYNNEVYICLNTDFGHVLPFKDINRCTDYMLYFQFYCWTVELYMYSPHPHGETSEEF